VSSKAKRAKKASPSLPLDSADWLPLNDVYRSACTRTDSAELAIADLERPLNDGSIRAKKRWLDPQGKPSQQLLDFEFWHGFKIRRWKDGLAVCSRANQIFNPDAVFYVWKPDVEKIWPTSGLTPSASGSAGVWIDYLFPKGEWRLMTAKDIHQKIVPKAKEIETKAPSYSAVAAELKKRQT
jgi:hypothetical protein